MRASRLLQLLMLLQSRGRMTARELAAELEVSVRTVYRDVEALGSSGVPVYADRGPAGGYRLLDGYRTRLTGLTGEEAESLFLTGLPGPAAELGLGAVVAATQVKVLAALPPELRSRAGRVRERFHLDAPGWFRGAEGAPHLAAVADAVWRQRRVRIGYARWDGSAGERVVEPLGLVLKAGLWYLVARAGDLRTYRVSRVGECAPLDEVFERPAGFDLAEYWAAWSERFEERMCAMHVVVRMTPRGLRRARVLLSLAASRALEFVEPDGEWTTVRLPAESPEHALVELLKLGADVEVLEPADLRAHVIATVEALSATYTRPRES
ncbi:YafY family protein [Saccharothrix longispora]|uniref:DNA-binding transcriptional regulator YafY n=1 Tax=Saccharothrix longispora TaxID=33920 RepID=A0ABU1PY81_9PSEU|nr:YafY family protein [Saccharothrix longispora]MDR6595590.1 putative DNA-binding transcriptional regulator YafY [Saccharothrix longispora]